MSRLNTRRPATWVGIPAAIALLVAPVQAVSLEPPARAQTDGVELYFFVASRRDADVAVQGPHWLTRESARISIAEYRQAVLREHGAGTTVRAREAGDKTCYFVFRNEADYPGRQIVVFDATMADVRRQAESRTRNGGSVIVGPACGR